MNRKREKKGPARTNEFSRSGGFALMYTVLISSLMIAIGFGIYSIVHKRLILTSMARESKHAFYAADSGVECALYWDVREQKIATSSFSREPGSGVMCAENDIATSWIVTKRGASGATTEFSITLNPGNRCAEVEVVKRFVGDTLSTTIESRGYNTCDTTNERRVERGIRVTY